MSNTNLLGSYGAQDGSSLMFRNRIINGDMRIDQRNAGVEVTPTVTVYTLDRWVVNIPQPSKLKIGRNAGAVTPPVGFTNYAGITSLSAYTVTANQAFDIEQVIEGFNISDFAWGTADAKPATLSFWVRSSLTGTFGGSIATTGSGVWVLPFTFTISVANTWSYITVSIPPGISALTNNDNTHGIFVRFGLGCAGTSSGGTPGVWTNAGNYIQPAGTVSVVGTNGATFYITGVQLEAGSVATPFERRPIGVETQLAMRYYQVKSTPSNASCASGNSAAGSNSFYMLPLPVPMRAFPVATVSGSFSFRTGGADNALNSLSVASFDAISVQLQGTHTSLSNGLSGSLFSSGGTTTIALSAEL